MTKPPASSEPKTKTVNDKMYHWCEGNGVHKPKWVIHEPKDCKGCKSGNPGSGGPVAAGPVAAAPAPSMRQPAWNISSVLLAAKDSE